MLVWSVLSWIKDDHQDDYAGVNTLTSSSGLMASVVLVIVSEVMLFVAVLWSVLLALLTHAIYTVHDCTQH